MLCANLSYTAETVSANDEEAISAHWEGAKGSSIPKDSVPGTIAESFDIKPVPSSFNATSVPGCQVLLDLEKKGNFDLFFKEDLWGDVSLFSLGGCLNFPLNTFSWLFLQDSFNEGLIACTLELTNSGLDGSLFVFSGCCTSIRGNRSWSSPHRTIQKENV